MPASSSTHTLKQNLIDFVLDAEGELAQALESYAAKQVFQGLGDAWGGKPRAKQDIVIENFAFEGNDSHSPIDIFIQSHPELPDSDQKLLQSWHQSFVGLFAINQIFTKSKEASLADGFEVTNWLTNKTYFVKPDNPQTQQDLARLKLGEIILTRIIPVAENEWTFTQSYILMGKLGKPKLAVAIGNFKENYKRYLYGDAPELLAEAWKSVEIYHQEFQDFFQADEITMPGYQLSQKINEFQEILTKKRLETAGIDSSKSFAEIIETAGVDEKQIMETAANNGVDQKLVSQILDRKSSVVKMASPKIDLPPEIKKAEQVTLISHPRWGQMFLPTYSKIQLLLNTTDWQNVEGGEKIIRFYLEDKSINSFIWHRLAQIFPQQLELMIQEVLKRPEFKLNTDLNLLLEEFGKPLEPELPEIASVPVHLHNLFQEAFAEVNKSKSKDKVQKSTTKGFQR